MGLIRRVGPVAVVAVAMLVALAGLGQLMMPRWQAQAYTDHIAIVDSNPAIEPRGIAIDHPGKYKVRVTRLSVDTADGTKLPAVLREPVDAAGRRPACLFIHGSGSNNAEDFGDIAFDLASAGIVTLVPAKRTSNYTPLHRDYVRFAEDYGSAFDLLRSQPSVDPAKTGVYAESEGTWISTIMAEHRDDIAFGALTSAPVFRGREQMAMAVSAYAKAAGAPDGVIRDIAKVMSLDFAPFDLQYADFDAAGHRDSLTMPLLVSYGTLDPAMPIEQGARTVLEEAAAAGNHNVTVRYYEANHQLRAGQGLFTPGLPLAEGYTRAVADWINGVAAGAGAEDWATPQIAGMQPDQRYAAPERTPSGIVGSLGVLVGLMQGALLCLLAAGLLGLGLKLVGLRRERAGSMRGRGGNAKALAAGGKRRDDEAEGVYGRGGRALPRGVSKVLVAAGGMTGALLALLCAYMAYVMVQAVYDQSNPVMFELSWRVLQLDAVVCAVLTAWMLVRVVRAVRGHMVRGFTRWAVVVLSVAGTLLTLFVLAFWGLYSL